MGTPKMQLVRRGALLIGLGLGATLASLDGADRPSLPMLGQAWSVPLPENAALELVWIPPGTFLMGSPETEPGRAVVEGPQTRVTLTKGYWLGKTFVTIGQWKSVMGVGVRDQLVKKINDETLHDFRGRKQRVREFMRWSPTADPATYLGNEEDNLPIYFVSWDDAVEFAEKLNQRERAAGRLPAGYEYNLPTEAQWEYACRAGTTTATYAGTNEPAVLDRLAWYNANSAVGYTGKTVGTTRFGPRAVGQKEPNAWGLHDMYGNIWQWCRDWFGPYPGGSVIDPTGPVSGNGRVNRGGSFGSGPDRERSAYRAENPQPEASAYRGFRLALCPVEERANVTP